MQITVRLFATLRYEAGWSEKHVDVPEESTLGALLSTLDQSDRGLTLSGRPVYAAVNQDYAKPDRILEDGDVVALFPPVSGGCARGWTG